MRARIALLHFSDLLLSPDDVRFLRVRRSSLSRGPTSESGPGADVTTRAFLFWLRRLSHSFRDGTQQDMLSERLAQIGDAPGVHRLIARGLIVVCSHEDDGPLRSRCRKPAL
jgi:hypothetical protein